MATMNVVPLMATESRSRQEEGEASSVEAAGGPPPNPYGLTAEALKALGQEGAQVLVYSGSRRMLFHGSKALEGNSAMHSESASPVKSDDDTDIFTDIDPDYHTLIVQHGQSTMRFSRPTEDMLPTIKGVIARYLRTNGTFSRTNQKRKQKLLKKEGGSCEKPDIKLPSTINVSEPVLQNNNFSVIVIKKVSGNIKLRPSNCCPIKTPSIEQLMKLAREEDEDCALGVVFVEWKLNAPTLPALPLVPSLCSHLPWFYIANPGPSQDNHIFGNIATRQSFLVANSDLQSSSSLLYSKDGWLLLQGRERNLSVGWGSPRYPVFLLNPATGARLDLPNFYFPSGYAAFCTTTQGTPGVVIYVICRGNNVRVYMVRPGGAHWEEHPYVFRHGQIGLIWKMVLCGDSVYCFFTLHCLIFKLADLSWHLVTGGSLKRRLVLFEALEVEGKVVVVGHPQCFPKALLGREPIPFFRMEINGDELDWVEITGSDTELDGRIWFVDGLQSFCVKVAGCGQKICWFEGNGISALHCLNLTTRAHCRLTADSIICSEHAWVDLGCPSDLGFLDCEISSDNLLPSF